MHNFKRTYCTPFKKFVPNDIELHLKKKSLYKRYMKYLKRYLFIYLKGQKDLEVFSILPNDKNILWINISAPSFFLFFIKKLIVIGVILLAPKIF